MNLSGEFAPYLHIVEQALRSPQGADVALGVANDGVRRTAEMVVRRNQFGDWYYDHIHTAATPKVP